MSNTYPASTQTPPPADAPHSSVPLLYWLILAVAIVSEVTATSLLKSTEGFTRLWPSVIVMFFYELAFFLLTITVKKIAVSVVYAIWGGAGAVFVTVVAWVWLGQALDTAALIGISLIIAGVVMMQGFSRTTHA